MLDWRWLDLTYIFDNIVRTVVTISVAIQINQPHQASKQNGKSLSSVESGGPGYPGALSKLLAKRIAAVPPGGSIDWVTYYFRDRALAEALVEAHKRGVNVTVCLPAAPRTSDANESIISMLSGPDGIGNGLHVISLPGIPAPKGRAWNMQLHEKLYCFSDPEPIAYIGS